MKLKKLPAAVSWSLILFAVACTGGDDSSNQPEDLVAEVAALSHESHTAVPATGRVVEVKMITDDKGNYFEPAEIDAVAGDVIRFTLVSGVHNVSFPADQNAGAGGLPPASEYLQLPGQTYDLSVDLAPGSYNFQCDPHAALGMVGKLNVRSE